MNLNGSFADLLVQEIKTPIRLLKPAYRLKSGKKLTTRENIRLVPF